MKRLILMTFFILLALVAGCESSDDDMGVVARVNGRAIPLSQLEFQHDLLHMDGAGTFVPSVEALRGEYGNILAELIVFELVEQELEQKGLSVTDDEMAAEEAKVRADYPDGAFEQVLIEEYIDLVSWRKQLRYDKSRRKFFQSVLRSQVKVDYLEADSYYKEHIKDFRLPESYRLVVLRGAQRGTVEKAVAAYRELEELNLVREKVPGVSVNDLTVSAGQISIEWKDALASLPEAEVSSVLQTRTGFEALVLLKKMPAKVLGPTQAYPLVEEALLETKLSEAFEIWLAAKLEIADIRISAHLLEKETESVEAVSDVEEKTEMHDESTDAPMEDAPEEVEPQVVEQEQ